LGFTLVSPLDVRIVVSGPRAVESAPAVALERTWDAPLLRWRLANPSGHYRLLGRGRRGHVLARSSVPGLPVILTSRLPGPGWEQLRSAGSLSAPARVWIGLDPRRREIFPFSFPIPMRLRPSPLNLIFKPLRPGLSAPPADSVRFSVLDFDAY
ncbi:MAG TPA: hypothetical protein VFF73_08565, partial [Planctomycetota bacterium]|nr:hypothetical protein [Planctomycetota bacterium]